MDTVHPKDFDRKIADIDKKVKQAQKRVDTLKEEKKALEITKESFFGKKAKKTSKKDEERSAIFEILEHGKSMHYKAIAKEAEEKYGVKKSIGAFYTMLDRMAKEDDMLCPVISMGRGEFMLGITNAEILQDWEKEQAELRHEGSASVAAHNVSTSTITRPKKQGVQIFN